MSAVVHLLPVGERDLAPLLAASVSIARDVRALRRVPACETRVGCPCEGERLELARRACGCRDFERGYCTCETVLVLGDQPYCTAECAAYDMLWRHVDGEHCQCDEYRDRVVAMIARSS